jgi:hypothetical protein
LNKTPHNSCFPQQRQLNSYKTEEKFGYFKTQFKACTANTAAAESSLTLAAMLVLQHK